ncbi:MAG: hypothetical protein DRQ62_09980, partial [Gammaproteobacteria bacterium]
MIKKVLFLCFLVAVFLGINFYNSYLQQSTERQSEIQLEIINIGRLICGGHLPLAIVEKKYQSDLKTFQLHTVQNHDWNDVIADMKSGKMAGTFILSPLAMNLIHEGFPGKIVLMADRNGNGFVLSEKLTSIDALKNQLSIIAVPHIYSQHHVLLHTVLIQHNIPQENV